jgi:hypothetical protein
MKRNIILAIVIILVGLAGIAAYAYFASFHKVSVVFSPDVSSATIYTEKGTEAKKLTARGKVSLQNGNYYATPDGQKVSKDPIRFDIKDRDLTLTLDPDYSSDFLKTTLNTEQTAITAAAESAFPLIAQNYTIGSNTLYRHGEWFGALLTQKNDTRNELDYYRIILHKESGTWKVVGKPELVMSKAEFKDVPDSVLKSVNQLSQ